MLVLQTATFHSRLSFPLDMLRYDECHPKTDFDADKITLRGEREITVARIAEKRCAWTLDRWASFGWRLVEASSDTLKGSRMFHSPSEPVTEKFRKS